MRWVSAASDLPDLEDALDHAVADLQQGLGGQSADLLLVFISRHHLFDYGRVLGNLTESLGEIDLLGCSAAAVIGRGEELEGRPGVALMAACLPLIENRIISLQNAQLPALDGSPKPWRDLLNVDPALEPCFVVLGDPFSCDAAHLLQGLDYAYPGASVVGGLASGSQGPGSTALFSRTGIRQTGALILALWGNIEMDTIVAQGCRPVGAVARVSACEGNLLKELDGRPPLEMIRELMEELDEAERQQLGSSLQLGVVMNEMREEIGHGDFLIRNILGMHQESGMMAVGAELHPGQTIQFHVRDGATAARDIRTLLRRYGRTPKGTDPAGALLFSCLGRGVSLYGSPNHDSNCFVEEVQELPIGGFFCNGEIGPVAGTTYLHGYTSVFGIFRPKSG